MIKKIEFDYLLKGNVGVYFEFTKMELEILKYEIKNLLLSGEENYLIYEHNDGHVKLEFRIQRLEHNFPEYRVGANILRILTTASNLEQPEIFCLNIYDNEEIISREIDRWARINRIK